MQVGASTSEPTESYECEREPAFLQQRVSPGKDLTLDESIAGYLPWVQGVKQALESERDDWKGSCAALNFHQERELSTLEQLKAEQPNTDFSGLEQSVNMMLREERDTWKTAFHHMLARQRDDLSTVITAYSTEHPLNEAQWNMYAPEVTADHIWKVAHTFKSEEQWIRSHFGLVNCPTSGLLPIDWSERTVPLMQPGKPAPTSSDTAEPTHWAVTIGRGETCRAYSIEKPQFNSWPLGLGSMFSN